MRQAGYTDTAELPELDETAQLLLSGLVIMADWLASNPAYFPLIPVGVHEFKKVCGKRGENAYAALEHFLGAWDSSTYTMDEAAFEERFGFAPNAVQSAIISAAEQADRPGIFILEAQMGVGKTEAALAAAEVLCANTGCGGMFFGLPTQATANGIFPRLSAWAAAQSEEFMHTIRPGIDKQYLLIRQRCPKLSGKALGAAHRVDYHSGAATLFEHIFEVSRHIFIVEPP